MELVKEEVLRSLENWTEKLFSRELDGQPCYILRSDELHRDDLPDGQFFAFTGALASERHENLLRARNRWRGRGFAAVFSPHGLRMSANRQCHLVIHELAHFIQLNLFRTRYPLSAEVVAKANQTPVSLSNSTADAPTVSFWESRLGRCPPWVFGDHGVDFIRLALHLGYRADLQGFPFQESFAALAGEQYGLSHPAKYRAALSAELSSRRWDPLAEIVASPPPSELHLLFLRDMVEWSSRGINHETPPIENEGCH